MLLASLSISGTDSGPSFAAFTGANACNAGKNCKYFKLCAKEG